MDKVLSLLGLAARGRNLVSGEFSTEKAVKEGRASLVVVGTDASDNTKRGASAERNRRAADIRRNINPADLEKGYGL